MAFLLIAMIILFPLGGTWYLSFSQAYINRRGKIRHGYH